MLSLLIRDLNLTLKPYGLQVVELPKEDQNPHSSAVRMAEPPVLNTVPEPIQESVPVANSKRERLMRLMSQRA